MIHMMYKMGRRSKSVDHSVSNDETGILFKAP